MGAKKYGPNSWLREGAFDINASRYSTIRHALKSLGLHGPAIQHILDIIQDIQRGFPRGIWPEVDDESGLLHDKHYGVRGLMVSYLLEREDMNL